MKESEPAEGQPHIPAIKKSTSQNESDYQILGTVGKGAYGMVSLAEKGGKLYAIKRIQKKKLAKQCKEYQAFVERELLRKINHPGIIKLAKCYQDPKHLNYVLEYCHGGDFTNFIRLNNKLITEEMRVFYVAQIVSILQYLHGVGVTHRDLKPQNIMLSKDGHIKLIDFGTAQITRCTILDQKFKEDIEKQKKSTGSKKIIQQPTEDDQNGDEDDVSPRKRRSTFVGTCYYLSPELLQFNICQPPSDLWALGCIIYQLYYLDPPFKASTEYQLFQKIKNVEINFPKNQSISEEAIDLIKRLLVKVPEDRLGSNQKQGLKWKDLKAHPYFKNVDFEALFSQKVPPLKQEEYKKQEHDAKLEKIKVQIEGDHDELFKKKQQILYSDIVDRKTFASYSPCYLILNKGFTLLKIIPTQPEPTKLSITPLSEGVAAELIDDNKFMIIADECNWTIRTNNAAKWVQLINNEFKLKS